LSLLPLLTGMDLPHDCKLGVCMTCPAKMVGGVSLNVYILHSNNGSVVFVYVCMCVIERLCVCM
jgi:ferredoxin